LEELKHKTRIVVIEITLIINIFGFNLLLKIFILARIIMAATQIVSTVSDDDMVSQEKNLDVIT
jgi:hypothetical protein